MNEIEFIDKFSGRLEKDIVVEIFFKEIENGRGKLYHLAQRGYTPNPTTGTYIKVFGIFGQERKIPLKNIDKILLYEKVNN